MVIADLEHKIDEQEERIVSLEVENKILREEVQLLKKGLFGRKTERLDAGQLGMFLAGASAGAADAPAPPKKERKQAKGHGRALFSPDLPRNIIDLDVAEADQTCESCGKAMVLLGTDVTERGHWVPARMVVNRYVRCKYACRDGHGVTTALLPDGVIDGGKFESSVYAHIATAKYADHLPLHRLEGIFKRNGMQLAKQTMWDMLKLVDELVAQPVLAQMRIELLEEPVLHADETPVTMRLEGGKGTKKGYAWGWRNLRRPGKPSKSVVEFRTNRGRDGPADFLGKWSGSLIIDGYVGYDETIRRNDITRIGCWSHGRRKINEAVETGSTSAERLLALVQTLFELERPINKQVEAGEIKRDEQVERRRVVRREQSAGIVDAIYAEVEDLQGQRSTLPKSKLGKALSYLVSQRQALSVFLEDPRVPIHNNDAERDLRHLAVGRKNWLVFGSQRGGEVACRLYSLMLSCKQCGANPEAYLEDVLMKVATTPASQIATLTPWAWAEAQRAEPDTAS